MKTVDSSNSYSLWNNIDYTGSGAEMIVVGSSTDQKIYIYGRRTGATFSPCVGIIKTDKNEHCGLYSVRATDMGPDTVSFDPIEVYNLVDTFIPDDTKKRVKINDLKFYISGDGEKTEHKVTLVFTLALMPRI
jgi:hypothetical protein